ncbi:MAG TPA: hypothetical protein VK171_13005 [Fimbriimonas sp.]|nr:hypothetical protein [Fimbriimonas sp.]
MVWRLMTPILWVLVGCGSYPAERENGNDIRDVIVASMIDANKSHNEKPYILEREFGNWTIGSFDSFISELEEDLLQQLSDSPDTSMKHQDKPEFDVQKLETIHKLTTIERIRQRERIGEKMAPPKLRQFSELSWPPTIKLEPATKEPVEVVMDKMLRNQFEPRVRFSPPAFSPSGRFAAVNAMELHRPLLHPIGWRIILEYRGNGWEVLTKDYIYFV